jgi:peptidoglycan/LPS O-acetylase OafA/YrhL
MTDSVADLVDHELPAAGDESGTAPGDRRFRPDVEGLRAVAILLVVLYHGGLNVLSGGYVGVDVFFVISGFVITGVLLRERVSSGRTSFLSFYGRRSRRIIPAATLVIVVTVTATYWVLGGIYGNPTATDARWTAVFLANFHFTSLGTNYLNEQQPPSPLLNFWSLAVEEQFYLVYPALFMLIATLHSKLSLRVRLVIGLVTVIAISFTLSVVQTNSNPTVAYFSPFTRAWELALGALVAVGTKWLLRLPTAVSSIMTWVGLGAIGFSAVVFGANTVYPGSLVAVPVLGTGLVIAGGVRAPRWAAECVLGLSPFRWIGRLSYSLYLWHWPLLVIAADAAGRSNLPFRQNAVWLLVALVASVVTYRLIENPIRHAPIFQRAIASIGLGIVLIVITVAVATFALNAELGGVSARVAPLSNSEVANLVRRAPDLRSLPTDLMPSLADAPQDWGGPPPSCSPAIGGTSIPDSCVFGDTSGSHTMVIYGDSHAEMWFDALNIIAKEAHWKLVDLGRGYCPAGSLSYRNPPGWGTPGGEYSACDQWHRFAIRRINQLKPDLVVVSQDVPAVHDDPHQWQQGLEATLMQLDVPKTRVVVLGNIPILPQNAPECLSRHVSDIQACSGPVITYLTPFNQAEKTAAYSVGAHYLDVTPWFCSTVCTGVIGRYDVFVDQFHVGATYTYVLEGVLRQALHISTAARRPT